MWLSTRYVITNELWELFKGLYFFLRKRKPYWTNNTVSCKVQVHQDLWRYIVLLFNFSNLGRIYLETHPSLSEKMHFTIMIFFTGQKFYFSLTRCTLSSHYVSFLKHNLLPRYSVRIIEYNGETQLPLLYFNISAYERHSPFCELLSQ